MAFKNKSLYKVKPSEDEDENLGYDYRGNMLKNMLSNKLYSNSFLLGYLDKLEEAVYFLYTVSKRVSSHYDYSKDKDENRYL